MEKRLILRTGFAMMSWAPRTRSTSPAPLASNPLLAVAAAKIEPLAGSAFSQTQPRVRKLTRHSVLCFAVRPFTVPDGLTRIGTHAEADARLSMLFWRTTTQAVEAGERGEARRFDTADTVCRERVAHKCRPCGRASCDLDTTSDVAA